MNVCWNVVTFALWDAHLLDGPGPRTDLSQSLRFLADKDGRERKGKGRACAWFCGGS